MAEMHQVAVLGGGSFGTVVANIVASNGHSTKLWLRNLELAEHINQTRENSEYLPGYHLAPSLEATNDLVQAVSSADIVFVAVPSQSFRQVARDIAPYIKPSAAAISTTKGLEPGDFRLMSQILAEELPNNTLGVLSGPNLAKEIAAGQLTGTVIASQDEALNVTIQQLMQSPSFRVYGSNDMYGVELGGALKNIYAIMAGLGAALELGQNTIGMLITRSLTEMSRFAVEEGANPLTFLGLSGVGDLIGTCSSPLSRNYRVGFALGKGQALDDIIDELGQVAEGINTLKLVKQEADKRGVYMPLVNGLYDMLYNRKTVSEILDGLMLAQQSHDVGFALPEN
jgi:glycerol-3-phosphate dehydrogenase (NAD(P)+)